MNNGGTNFYSLNFGRPREEEEKFGLLFFLLIFYFLSEMVLFPEFSFWLWRIGIRHKGSWHPSSNPLNT